MNFDFRNNTEKRDLVMQPPVDNIKGDDKKFEFRIGSSQDYLPIDWYKAYYHLVLNVKKSNSGLSCR